MDKSFEADAGFVMKIFIKNMVCPRCIMAVADVFSKNGVATESVQLGEVVLSVEPAKRQMEAVKEDLHSLGFEILDDARSRLIERIKSLLIQKVQSADIEDHFSLNKFLTGELFKDYSTLSKLFSEVEGVTIEQFFIQQKIEKVKELLVYDEMPLYLISMNLGYSSSQHLSGQFKKITGMTPGEFKKSGGATRVPIDEVGKKN